MSEEKTFPENQLLQGVSGAPGLACGPAFIWQKTELHLPDCGGQNPETELSRLEAAIQTAIVQIKGLNEKLNKEGHLEEAKVFDAHVQLVQDKGLVNRVKKGLASGMNVETVWNTTVEAYASQLEAMPDPLFRLRAADLRDVGERVLRILLKVETRSELSQPSVVIARDLTPSETVSMKKDYVLAFCTAEGGPTSHTSILAKALRIPAVVSMGQEILQVPGGTQLLVDGAAGSITAQPDEPTCDAFFARQKASNSTAKEELATAHQRACTLDGKNVEVVANVGGADDARTALQLGAEGVGLFRTEFVFLQRQNPPTEEEQYAAYHEVLQVMEQRPVVIRTLDAGGDKELTYLHMPAEANPFLGNRAIRLCLSEPEFFKQQLRALLRAGVGHDLRIMFPMIASRTELRAAKQLIEEAKEEVLASGSALPEKLQVGIMVEIPSTAVLSAQFAREVDFFSIGTNDLTQYTLAADRTNPRLAYLNDPCHPAVLNLIRQTAEAAHKAGIWWGVCGEMAGDADAIPLLLAMGVDELSMSPGLIPHAKSLIRKISLDKAREVLELALEQESAASVRKVVQGFSLNQD